MSSNDSDVEVAVTHLAREDSGRVLALLAKRFGDLDIADEAVQAGLVEALRVWPDTGIPERPAAWLMTVARRKAIDAIRRSASAERRLQASAPELVADADDPATEEGFANLMLTDERDLPDERLRLIFLCCHPALASDAQVALTLRLVGGLTTEEVAAAFLVPTPTLAQRISRAKRKIREAGIPLSVPEDLAGRTAAVLSVLYLTFNEGYLSRSAESAARVDLCTEAIRLTAVLADLLPEAAEVHGLLALELFHYSRRATRFSSTDELVLLPDQDRSQWNMKDIQAANRALHVAMKLMAPGSYQLQAVIASHHANARTADETNWSAIVHLYRKLEQIDPSPVVKLNAAVAVSMADGPLAGLGELDRLEGLDDYNLFHSARAELLVRAGRPDDARDVFLRALELTENPAERRLLEQRLQEL